MGGTNEAVIPPDPQYQHSKSIRVHENQNRGEIDFHNDAGGSKVSIPTTRFFTAYEKWREDPIEPLRMIGRNQSGELAQVILTSYMDKDNHLQYATDTSSILIGDTIKDMDKLAGIGFGTTNNE